MRRAAGRIALIVALALAGAASAAGPAPRFDLIIRGGEVIDGTGRPRRRADVGVTGGHIVAVGDLARATAGRTIDARGLIVAPGFINIHSHADPAALASAENMLSQGVTTEIVNPDGQGPTDIAAQLANDSKAGLSVNVGAYIGFNAVWEAVMGQRDRRPSAGEIARMQGLITDNLKAGAWGVSSGLDYKPGYYATEDEVVEILKAAAPWRTNFPNHERVVPETGFSSRAGTLETLRIGARAGVTPIVTHIKSQGFEQGDAGRIVEAMRALDKDGRFGAADIYPYLAGQTGLAALIIPGWAQDGGRAAMLERFKDPAQRARIAAEGEQAIKARWNGPTGVYLPDTREELTANMARDGVSAGEAVIRALEQRDARVILRFGIEEDLKTFLGFEDAAVACDCGAATGGVSHPRYYGTFPRVLGRYARDQRVLSLEQAVRRMTGLPAALVGIADRGLVAPGMAADLVVFDPKAVIDNASFEAPTARSSGIAHVLVAGTFAVMGETPTGAKAGRVLLRRPDLPTRRLRLPAGRMEVAGPAGVKIAFSRARPDGAVAGEARFSADGSSYRIAGADLGVLQLAPGWSSITGVARAVDGAAVPAVLVLDRPAGGGPSRLRIDLASGKSLSVTVD